jgi:hypothetical protein
VTEVPIIGRGCRFDASFTHHIARSLGLVELHQEPDESEVQFLVRRLTQIQWVSRHWARSNLQKLDADLLKVAAVQICNAAADYCQDRIAERLHREAMTSASQCEKSCQPHHSAMRRLNGE